VNSLRAFGVLLTVYDFGTRSALSYLNRLPIDTLKIDRSFVMGLPDDSGSIALTRSLIVLARNLWLDVIAEGGSPLPRLPSSPATAARTSRANHLSEPVPREEFPETVRRIEQGDAVAGTAE
jgi:EAL domain-containing protein (putative c-di-GMP-specific phosphodiesterase class I)